MIRERCDVCGAEFVTMDELRDHQEIFGHQTADVTDDTTPALADTAAFEVLPDFGGNDAPSDSAPDPAPDPAPEPFGDGGGFDGGGSSATF